MKEDERERRRTKEDGGGSGIFLGFSTIWKFPPNTLNRKV
jgi:hypothetical protein